jgi:hypothetical protein
MLVIASSKHQLKATQSKKIEESVSGRTFVFQRYRKIVALLNLAIALFGL